jgi:hypothetical protein
MAASIVLMAGVAVQVTSESREQLLAGKVSSCVESPNRM